MTKNSNFRRLQCSPGGKTNAVGCVWRAKGDPGSVLCAGSKPRGARLVGVTGREWLPPAARKKQEQMRKARRRVNKGLNNVVLSAAHMYVRISVCVWELY